MCVFLCFFLMWTILKSSLNLLQHGFCSVVWCLGHMVCNILVPWPGIKPTPPASEGEVLTTRDHQESPCLSSSWVGFCFIAELQTCFLGSRHEPLLRRMIHSAPSCSLSGLLTSAVVPVEAQMCCIVTRPHFSLFLGWWFPGCCSRGILPDLGS